MDSGVEANIRTLCERGAHDQATTAALKAYGDETLRFLHALVRNEADASEVFSVFAEDLWQSLPRSARVSVGSYSNASWVGVEWESCALHTMIDSDERSP